jgi:hypothetical protein
MKKLILLSLTAIILSACDSDKPTTITVNGKYSIDIPSFLTKSELPGEEFTVQYENVLRAFHLVTIDESMLEMEQAYEEAGLSELYENNIDSYAEIVFSGIEENVEVYKKSAIADTTINGLPARMMKFNARVEGFDLYYTAAAYQGKDTFHQVMTWTLTEKQAEFEKQMEDIMYSFKEI